MSSVPQQIFIPGLNIASGKQQIQKDEVKSKSDLNSLAYRLNENQLNDLFNLLNANPTEKYFNNPLAKHEQQIQERNSMRKNVQMIPKPEMLQQNNKDLEKYFNEAEPVERVSTDTTTSTEPTTTIKETTPSTTASPTTTTKKEVTTEKSKPFQNLKRVQATLKPKESPKLGLYRNSMRHNSMKHNKFSYGNQEPQLKQQFTNTEPSMGYNDCNIIRDSRKPDNMYCNLYHMCSNGIYAALLCPESYLFSMQTLKCEHRSKVDCGSRMALDFDRSNVPDMDFTINDYYNSAR